MKQYKYSLDRSSKKFICPKCLKKTFVKYIETESGNYLNDEFGRCDRETNCQYHRIPLKEMNETFKMIEIPELEPSFHDMDLVINSGRNFKQNNFIQFLRTIFSDFEIKEIILKYALGTSKRWSGATVFWQLDQNQKVRNGKIMLYEVETGKRVKNKDGTGFISTVRSVMKLKDFNLKQCLFGLHLTIELNPSKDTIALVESEKTAVIMALFKPEYTWLSTGSKQGLKYDYLKPIKQYKIVAFPDKSEYHYWLNKANELNKRGFKINVSDWLEGINYKEGTDLADVFIIEKNNITEEPVINYTNTEQVIHQLEKSTPEIWSLIKTFDLTSENGNEIRKIPKH